MFNIIAGVFGLLAVIYWIVGIVSPRAVQEERGFAIQVSIACSLLALALMKAGELMP